MNIRYIPLPFSKPGTNRLITGIRSPYSELLLPRSSSIVGISFLSPPDVPELQKSTHNKKTKQTTP